MKANWYKSDQIALLKRIYLCLFIFFATFLFAITPQAFAGTNISGTISTDTTWPLEGSPYVINSGIAVAQGGKLKGTARVAPKECIYHILTRGNNRQDVSEDEEDIRRYLDGLLRYIEKYQFKLYHCWA